MTFELEQQLEEESKRRWRKASPSRGATFLNIKETGVDHMWETGFSFTRTLGNHWAVFKRLANKVARRLRGDDPPQRKRNPVQMLSIRARQIGGSYVSLALRMSKNWKKGSSISKEARVVLFLIFQNSLRHFNRVVKLKAARVALKFNTAAYVWNWGRTFIYKRGASNMEDIIIIKHNVPWY